MDLYDAAVGVALEQEGAWRFDPGTKRFRNMEGHFIPDPLYDERLRRYERAKRAAAEEKKRADRRAEKEAVAQRFRAYIAQHEREWLDLPVASVLETEAYIEEARERIERQTAENTEKVAKLRSRKGSFVPEELSQEGLPALNDHVQRVLEVGAELPDTTGNIERPVGMSLGNDSFVEAMERDTAVEYLRGELSLMQLRTVRHFAAVLERPRPAGPLTQVTRLRPILLERPKSREAGQVGCFTTHTGRVMNAVPTARQYMELLALAEGHPLRASSAFCIGDMSERVRHMLPFAGAVHAMLDQRVRQFNPALRARYLLPTWLRQIEEYPAKEYTIVGAHGQLFTRKDGGGERCCLYSDPAWALFVGTETHSAPVVLYLDEALNFIAPALCQVDPLTMGKGRAGASNPHTPVTPSGQRHTLETWLAIGMDKYEFGVTLPKLASGHVNKWPRSVQPEDVADAFEVARALEAAVAEQGNAPRSYAANNQVGHGTPRNLNFFPEGRRPHTARMYLIPSETGRYEHVFLVTDPGTAQESYFTVRDYTAIPGPIDEWSWLRALSAELRDKAHHVISRSFM